MNTPMKPGALVKRMLPASENSIRIIVLGAVIGMIFGFCPQVHASAYAPGDVFASIGNGMVSEYTPSGTLVQTLNTTLGGTTTGMAFDSSGNLYVTDFSTGNVSKFNNNGNLVNATFVSGLTNPESITLDSSGNLFVGDAGSNLVHKYSPTGTLLNTYTLATENRGTDWVALAGNQKTLFYTSEGSLVKRFDTATNTQLSNFATLPGSAAYALRLLPDGGALVADSQSVIRLDSSGNVIHSYSFTGESTWFSLNLNPNGTSFWSGNFGTGNIYEFNTATGAEIGMIATGSSNLFGVAVFGEVTVATGVPETGPGLALTAICLLGLPVAYSFRKRRALIA